MHDIVSVDYTIIMLQQIEVQAASRDASRPTSAGGAGDSDVGSEGATGSGEGMSEEPQEDELSDISETGWETDLDIEGK